jgi:hypothetical protein
MAIKEGYLSPDFNPDQMRWTRSMFKNTPVSAEALGHIRTLAWKLTNDSEFVAQKENTGIQSLASVEGDQPWKLPVPVDD